MGRVLSLNCQTALSSMRDGERSEPVKARPEWLRGNLITQVDCVDVERVHFRGRKTVNFFFITSANAGC